MKRNFMKNKARVIALATASTMLMSNTIFADTLAVVLKGSGGVVYNYNLADPALYSGVLKADFVSKLGPAAAAAQGVYVVDNGASGVGAGQTYAIDIANQTIAQAITGTAHPEVVPTVNQVVGADGKVTSVPVTPTQQIAITGVTLSSTAPKVNDTLSATLTPAAATATYAWKVGGVTKGTSATFPVIADYVGQTITLTVTGTGNYSGTITSAATSVVPAVVPTGTVAVSSVSVINATSLSVTLSAKPATPATISDFVIKAGATTGTFSTALPIVGSGRISNISTDGLTYTFDTLNSITDGFAVYVDGASATSKVVSSTVKVSTVASISAPAITVPVPLRTSATTAQLGFTSGKAGNLYWIVVKSTDTAPTAAQVKAGVAYGTTPATIVAKGATTGDLITAGGNTIAISGLTEMAGYNLYYVSTDGTHDSSVYPVQAITAGISAYIPNGTYTVATDLPTAIAGTNYIYNNDDTASTATVTARNNGVLYTLPGSDVTYGAKLAGLIGKNGVANSGNLKAGDQIVISNNVVTEVIIDDSAAAAARTVALGTNVAGTAKVTVTGSTDDALKLTITGTTSGDITVKGGNVDVSNTTLTGKIIANGTSTIKPWSSSTSPILVNAADVSIVDAAGITSPVTIGNVAGASATVAKATITGAGATIQGTGATAVTVGGTGGTLTTAADCPLTGLAVSGSVTNVTLGEAGLQINKLAGITVNANATIGTLNLGTATVGLLTNLGGVVSNVTGTGTLTAISAASATAAGSVNFDTTYNKAVDITAAVQKLTVTGGVKAATAQTVTINVASVDKSKLDLSGLGDGIKISSAVAGNAIDLSIGGHELTMTAGAKGKVSVTAAPGAKVNTGLGFFATVNGVIVSSTGASSAVTVVSADELNIVGDVAATALLVDSSTVSPAVDKTVNLSGFTKTGANTLSAVGPTYTATNTKHLIVKGSWGPSSSAGVNVLDVQNAVDATGLTVNTSNAADDGANLTAANGVANVLLGINNFTVTSLAKAVTFTTTSGKLTFGGVLAAIPTVVTDNGVVTFDTTGNFAPVITTNTAFAKIIVTSTAAAAYVPKITAVPGTTVAIATGKTAIVNGVSYAPTGGSGSTVVTVTSDVAHAVALDDTTTGLTVVATAATKPIAITTTGGAANCAYTVTGGATADTITKLINNTTTSDITVVGGYVDVTGTVQTSPGVIKCSAAAGAPAYITAAAEQAITESTAGRSFAVNGILFTGKTTAGTVTLDSTGKSLAITDSTAVALVSVLAGTTIEEITTPATAMTIDEVTIGAGATLKKLSLDPLSVVTHMTVRGTVESGAVMIKDAAATVIDVSSTGVLGLSDQLTISKATSATAAVVTIYNGAKISAVFAGIAFTAPYDLNGLTTNVTNLDGVAAGATGGTTKVTYGSGTATLS